MAARRLRASEDTANCSDAALVRAASTNDHAAIAELYRRHAPAAERVARSVAGNNDDADDAVAEAFTRVFAALTSRRVGTLDFRSYVVAATRNAAIDHLRRSGRVGPSGDLAAIDNVEPGAGPPDHLLAGEESALMAQAFRDLPERWQSVLWLTEVERVTPAEAAGVLGLSANNVSQLALRARARLRERYLQGLVHNHAGPGCQSTVDRLGAYVAGTLTRRRRAGVEEHLAGCLPCRRRQADLEELGASLRRAVPVPLAAAGLLRRLGRQGGGGGAPPAQAGPTEPDADAAPASASPAVDTVRRRAVAGRASADAAHAVADPVVRLVTSVAGSPVTHALATNAVATMAPVAAADPVRRWMAAVVAAVVALVPGMRGGGDARPPAARPEASVAAPLAAPPPPEPADPGAGSGAAEPPPPPAPDPAPAAPGPPAAPPPAVVARPAAFTSHPRSAVAEAVGPSVTVFDSPGGAVSRVLGSPQPSGAPLVLLVVEQYDGWLHVLLPVRPNGSTGWVRAEEVEVTEHTYSIVIELGAHQITVFDGHQVILNEVIGVGTANTPTPGGLYYTKELIEPTNPGGAYGPYAYGLSGFSEVLDSFGGGDGTLGIHGTNDPSSLGRRVSHGCIRMSNAGITRLAGILPLGVPVEVRA